ncbi:MAG: enoyl-CoA hydratase/isomerase family protein [Flavobacteriaceae bacterium]|nr:enoyl-CoA hydratase/isomerase family protein [Flavobacteriaceae bacterium]
MIDKNISLNITNKIANIEFYTPKGNSLPSDVLYGLTKTINDLNQNKDVQIIVLSSKGEKVFCAGASFDELLNIETSEQGLAFFSGFANVINAIRKSDKIVVARVQGKAVGGGVGIISACDYVFAHSSASIKLSELSIGIGPFVIAPAVKRRIGLNAFTILTLNPLKWQSASWAFEKQLFTEIFDDIDKLNDRIKSFCNDLVMYSPLAIAEIKLNLWQGTSHWDSLLIDNAKVSGSLVLSEYTKKELLKFKTK